MTTRLVTAETLAAALKRSRNCADVASAEQWAPLILAALPVDPRLDALLAAARRLIERLDSEPMSVDGMRVVSRADDVVRHVRDALAAFEEKV